MAMPLMNTVIVEPSNGIVFGCGVSAHPKLTTVPDTVSPGAGVSMAPNGVVALAFASVTLLLPRTL